MKWRLLYEIQAFITFYEALLSDVIIAWFCLCIAMQEEVQKKVTEENRQRFSKFFRKDNQDDDQGGSGPANMCGGGVGNNWDSGRFIF